MSRNCELSKKPKQKLEASTFGEKKQASSILQKNKNKFEQKRTYNIDQGINSINKLYDT